MSTSFGQILSDIGPAFQIAGALALELESDYAAFESGHPVNIPTILTYIGGKQVAINITVAPAASYQAPTATAPK